MAGDRGNNSLRFSRLEISGTDIIERDGGRVVITIPREQIHRMKLCYDTDSRNPFCQYFLGFTLFSLGLIGLIVTFFASTRGASLVRDEPEYFVVPLVPLVLWLMVGLGLWFLAGIFRARYHLVIETGGRTEKIFFDKDVDIAQIRQFARRAQLYFGYEIDMSVLEKTRTSA